MPRKKNQTPSYLPHVSGQARVRINGHDIYLGKYGSPESKERYARIIAENFGPSAPPLMVPVRIDGPVTIAKLVRMYDDHARSFYVRNGESTDDRYRAVADPLVRLYGSTPAVEFTPLKLQAVRQAIIARGNLGSAEFDEGRKLLTPGEPLCREYVNCLMKSLVRIFKWAVGQELVPVSVHESLLRVDSLKKGRDARLRESDPVKPVPEENIWAVVKVCPPQIAAMIQVQYWAGGRPDEITIMRACDIEQSGPTWTYRPNSHKLDWLGHDKEILLGPNAQEVLKPWLSGRASDAYLFSPREAAEANAIALEKRRKKPNSKKVKISAKRPPREKYDDVSYRQAVVRACERAGVPKWTPGQLRHNAATRVRAEFGAEAAQVVLGHRNLSTTEIYAEKNRTQYANIMSKLG